MLKFWVNEQEVEVKAHEEKLYLLDYLRDVLKLTGAKRGCEDGVCGSCTVLIDGSAKKSCHVKLEKLEGKKVTTIEGLAKDGKLDPVQEAFIECSAIQCGFCSPGMIITAKALLIKNPNPTVEDIKRAYKPNVCRCGTYPRIIKAVLRAAAVMRGESVGPFVSDDEANKDDILGKSVRRLDVQNKSMGQTKFFADYYFDNMLHGKIVFSKYPHAEIVSIDTKAAEVIPGVQLVLTAKDIPGKNINGVLSKDQPVLAEDKVRFIGEPVAVVFADDVEAAEKGVEAVEVVYKELPGVFTIEEALSHNAPIIPNPAVGPFWNAYCGEKGNICKEVSLHRGNLEEAFGNADVVVEEEFVVPPEEHAWNETEGTVSRIEDGKIAIYAPNQSPFADREQLAGVLGLDVNDIKMVHLPCGGAFGGKTELTTHAYVAIASLKTGRPAKMVLTRKESLRFHPKRHSYKMKYRIAANKDGKLLGMDINILADGGAYISWTPRVIEQGVSFSTGPYYVPAFKAQATCVYTNNLVSGAMRGFGASQPHFAAESMMDILARKLDMDPIKVREINALDVGLPAATGQIFTAGLGYKDTISAAQKAVEEELLPLKQQGENIGIGVASAWRSVAGGLGPDELAGSALEVLENGKILLKIACTEMGQGSHTSLAQMVCKILDVDVNDIEIVAGDTDKVPYGGGVMASRGLYLWGHPTIDASHKLRKLLLEKSAAILEVSEESLSLYEGYIVDKETLAKRLSLQELAAKSSEPLQTWVDFKMPKSYPVLENANEDETIDPKEYNVHHTVAYNTTAVAVSVDKETGNVKVLNCTVAADGGVIINPESARTQIEGAIIMGLGYGLTNDFVIEKGINITDTLGKCHVPRIDIVPDAIKIIFVGDQDPTGPFGSKGVAEIGVLAIAPAITNAIYDAVGVRVNKLPVKKYLGDLLKG